MVTIDDLDGTGFTTYVAASVGDLARTVVTGVADTQSVDPLDLPPFGRHVDLDALEDLFERTAVDATPVVRFVAGGCDVVVSGTVVHVRPVEATT